MVTTRSICQHIFNQEVKRLAKIEFDIPAPSLYPDHSIVYRPLLNTIMAEQFMQTVSKEQIETLPKFSGAAGEDVVKWLQDIEEVFDRAQLQPANKFLAVQSYLTGAATKWFRFNKSTILDWSTFKSSIIVAYQPTLPQILDRMERRFQLVDESVMDYYHDKLALCSQADPQMSSSMLLHYLTKGLNPSLIPHVIRRHPTTPAEFLLVAQDEEKIRFTLAGLSSTTALEHDYSIDDIPIDPVVNAVQRPQPRTSPSFLHRQFQPPPPPLMSLPTPSFSSSTLRYPYRQSMSSSSSRQCYQCHRFGHIASRCPNRKNV